MSRSEAYLKEMGLWPRYRQRSPIAERETKSEIESPASGAAMDKNGGDRRAGIASMDWKQLKQTVKDCVACGLRAGCTQTVFGVGDEKAQWLFVGEGPGAEEDQRGEPFVGQAGRLLDNMLAAIGLKRGENVYIANIVKCRPPGNRVPMPDEVATCAPFLQRQLEIIRPRVIVTLGLSSLKYMTGDLKLAMGRSRGQWREWRGIRLMPTFHPAFVERSPTVAVRGAVWSDMKLVMAELGLPLPQRGG